MKGPHFRLENLNMFILTINVNILNWHFINATSTNTIYSIKYNIILLKGGINRVGHIRYTSYESTVIKQSALIIRLKCTGIVIFGIRNII
jgi:hypothetical protein